MVHHAVPKRRGGDEARFAFVNGEKSVSAGGIFPGLQLPLQSEQLCFQIQLEAGDGWSAALAAPGLAEGQQ